MYFLNGLTLVVASTLHSLGKSLTPWSSIAMLEPRSALEERREETQDAREDCCDITLSIHTLEGSKNRMLYALPILQ